MCWCAWAGVHGNEGAGRILQFFAWALSLSFLAAIFPAEFKEQREKGRTLPGWLSHGTGIALILFLVWHGWIWTAIALLLHEIGIAAIFRPNACDHGPRGDGS